jgi:hypothetical protein
LPNSTQGLVAIISGLMEWACLKAACALLGGIILSKQKIAPVIKRLLAIAVICNENPNRGKRRQ